MASVADRVIRVVDEWTEDAQDWLKDEFPDVGPDDDEYAYVCAFQSIINNVQFELIPMIDAEFYL